MQTDSQREARERPERGQRERERERGQRERGQREERVIWFDFLRKYLAIYQMPSLVIFLVF